MSLNQGAYGEFSHAYARNRHSNIHIWHSLICVMNTSHTLDRIIVYFSLAIEVFLKHLSLLHKFEAFLVELTCSPIFVHSVAVLTIASYHYQAPAALFTLWFYLFSLSHS